MTYEILVVDDELVSRTLIKAALVGDIFSIVFAENGREAVEKATSEDFDLIIMDLMMPFMDGSEAIKIIHMSEPDLPIIVVTGTEEEDMKTDALKCGANLIIQKPLELQELAAEVKRLLGISEAE